MQRERRSNTTNIDSRSSLVVTATSFPVEYHTHVGVDTVSTDINIPADIAKRLIFAERSKGSRAVGFNTNALEYFLYHFCKALVPPRENATAPMNSSSSYPRGSANPMRLRHGATVFGSVVHSLTREYICFFLPVAIPELSLSTGEELPNDHSAITQIRSRLHEFSPKKTLGGNPVKREQSRRPGIPCADILDVLTYSHSLELASFFASCVSLLWLPAIPSDVREAALRQVAEDGAAICVWIPTVSHLASLNLFHAVVGYIAKGERQLERFHLTGAVSPNSPVGRSATGKKTDVDSYEKRISMNGTIRDTLRTRCFTVPIADTLGTALSSCGHAGVADTDVWIPFLDTMVSIWIRYIMPWRGSKTEPSAPAASADISQVWRSRIPLIVKGIPSVLYNQAFAYFIKQMSLPQVDLLTNTAVFLDDSRGALDSNRGFSSLGAAVGNGLSFGSSHVADALTVVERAVSAFTGTELRAVLAAVEHCQLEAYPRLRSSLISDSSPYGHATADIQDKLDMQTPTKTAPSRTHGHQSPLAEEDARKRAFEKQVAIAQTLLSPYMQEIVASPPYTEMIVRALDAAEQLSTRQLRLLVPMRGADEARSLVSDIFAVISRIFSASDANSSSSSSSLGSVRFSMDTSEKMRARAQALHDAQARINSLYGRLAAAFGTTRKEIEAIKQAQDSRAAAGAFDPSGTAADARYHQQFAASSGFGERLAARGRLLNERTSTTLSSPDMDHGSLTPRGRWELKTGRKKFTSQSLLSPSRPLIAAAPGFGTDSVKNKQAERGQPLSQPALPTNSSAPADGHPGVKVDTALLPRGPRAYFVARSYENQWILDWVLPFNVWINRKYQQSLDALEAAAYPIPLAMRSCKLDFRFVAAYQNLRFFALVFAVWWILSWLFF
ncbi:hypothetical protein LPJ72_000307 [Coemansia sp. Benny D160-2]|nr:hypothetical protein LPJ72_000307 [Coemansia sp. Benny D160-2]